MENIKYEPVFGDQSLFDDAPEDCFCVAKNVYDDCVFYREVDRCLFWLDCGRWKPLQFMSCTPIAMRSIIRTPTWSVSDHKAGKLPEVGIKAIWTGKSKTSGPDGVKYPDFGVEIEIVTHTKTANGLYPVAVFKWLHEDGVGQCYAGSGHADDFKPIETPHEKAARLRDEWAESAIDDAYSSIGLRDREKPEHIMRYFRRVYEAMLSGDLPVPVAPEQNK